ncbi:hypothetical protein cyc_05743 [Cyclospora cayetanensis]|uniref:Uncharacterized protein n=1 Tax=Cyclospora cayetanensis TaxID=88456 RepID=A0A1D3CYE4_9EIME|nr:hypothetical protein cyc_05743 [Cyclospora cayetanensis]
MRRPHPRNLNLGPRHHVGFGAPGAPQSHMGPPEADHACWGPPRGAPTGEDTLGSGFSEYPLDASMGQNAEARGDVAHGSDAEGACCCGSNTCGCCRRSPNACVATCSAAGASACDCCSATADAQWPQVETFEDEGVDGIPPCGEEEGVPCDEGCCCDLEMEAANRGRSLPRCTTATTAAGPFRSRLDKEAFAAPYASAQKASVGCEFQTKAFCCSDTSPRSSSTPYQQEALPPCASAAQCLRLSACSRTALSRCPFM